VNPPVPHSTVPVRPAGGPPRFHRRPAPLLGEHNHEVLAELGFTDAEITELEAQGVIGNAPAGYAAGRAKAGGQRSRE